MEEGDEDGQRILGTGVCTVCMPRVPKVPRVPRMARQPKQPSGSSILLDGRLAGGGKPNSVGGPQEAGFFFLGRFVALVLEVVPCYNSPKYCGTTDCLQQYGMGLD